MHGEPGNIEGERLLGGRRALAVLGVGAVTETLTVQGDGEPVRVAKRLLPRFREEVEAQDMIRREARILSRLAGRGAPRLVEPGEDAWGPFLVMERVPMSRLSSRPKPLETPEEARRATRATLLALAEVHEADADGARLELVHGDVSPDNVLLAPDAGSAVFVDFGLSLMRGEEPPARGPFRGTLLYAAPEVAQGEPATAASDLFALGACLLEAASGQRPRASRGLAALLLEAAHEPLDAFAASASVALDPRLAEVLRACVQREPRDRPIGPRSAAEAL